MISEESARQFGRAYAIRLYKAFESDFKRNLAYTKSLDVPTRRRSFQLESLFRDECIAVAREINELVYEGNRRPLLEADKEAIWLEVTKALWPTLTLYESQDFQKRAAARVETRVRLSDELFLDLFNDMMQSSDPRK